MKKRQILIVVILLAFLSIGSVILWPSGETSPWAEATTPGASGCSSDACPELQPVDAGHGGESLGLAFDPAIDDAIAQWGDCLDSVLSCRRTTGDTRACVAASICPERCSKEFAAATSGQTDNLVLGQAFLDFFVRDGGACVPPSEDAE